MAKVKYTSVDVLKFLVYSLFGIFMFFVPIKATIACKESSSIPIDHILSLIKSIPNFGLVFGTFMVLAGLVYAIYTKS